MEINKQKHRIKIPISFRFFRILQGCVIPMVLALTFFTALSATGEYKSNMKKFVFATCVSIGFIETMQLIESQMGS